MPTKPPATSRRFFWGGGPRDEEVDSCLRRGAGGLQQPSPPAADKTTRQRPVKREHSQASSRPPLIKRLSEEGRRTHRVVTEPQRPQSSDGRHGRDSEQAKSPPTFNVESARAAAIARLRKKRREHRARWQQELEELTAYIDVAEPQDDCAHPTYSTPSQGSDYVDNFPLSRSSTPRTVLRHGYSRSVDIADRAAAAAGMQAAAVAAARARSFLMIARRRAAVYARQAEEKMRAAAANAHEASRGAARQAAVNSGAAAMASDETVRKGGTRAPSSSSASNDAAGAEPQSNRQPRSQANQPRYAGQLPSSPCDAIEKSHYSVLGVTRNASTAELKKAFFSLALKYHPDRSKSPESTARMMRINEAYSCLVDPVQRILYDALAGPSGRCS